MKRVLRHALQLALVAGMLLCALPVAAVKGENEIHSLAIDVVLHEDGSASLREVWDISVYSGTEWYIGKHNLDNMEITGLTVQDGEGTAYEVLPEWDSGLSAAKKAGRCGLLATTNGYEICWGFTGYGRQTYTVEYDLAGLVKGYEDGAALQFVFASGSRALPLKNATLQLRMGGEQGLGQGNTEYHISGLQATAAFEDGTLVITQSGAGGGSETFALAAFFGQGLFAPTDIRSGSIAGLATGPGATGVLTSLAASSPQTVIGLVLVLAVVVCCLALLYKWYATLRGPAKRAKRARRAYGRVEPSARLPERESLPASCVLLGKAGMGPDVGELAAGLLVLWMGEGLVRKPANGGKRHAVRLESHPPYEKLPEMEGKLYRLMLHAAGRRCELTPAMWYGWCREHNDRLAKWAGQYKQAGIAQLAQKGNITKGQTPDGQEVLTKSGAGKAARLFALRQWLQKPAPENLARSPWLYAAYALLLFAPGPTTKALKRLEKSENEAIQVQKNSFAPAEGARLAKRFANKANRGYWRGAKVPPVDLRGWGSIDPQLQKQAAYQGALGASYLTGGLGGGVSGGGYSGGSGGGFSGGGGSGSR